MVDDRAAAKELDQWVDQLMDCKPLTEAQVKTLCDKVWERLFSVLMLAILYTHSLHMGLLWTSNNAENTLLIEQTYLLIRQDLNEGNSHIDKSRWNRSRAVCWYHNSMLKLLVAKCDFGHFWSSEQHAPGASQLARHDFLLAFYSTWPLV